MSAGPNPTMPPTPSPTTGWWLLGLAAIGVGSFLLGRNTTGETPLASGVLESVTYETSPGEFVTQSGSVANPVRSRVYPSALVIGNGGQIIPLQRVFEIELRDR